MNVELERQSKSRKVTVLPVLLQIPSHPGTIRTTLSGRMMSGQTPNRCVSIWKSTRGIHHSALVFRIWFEKALLLGQGELSGYVCPKGYEEGPNPRSALSNCSRSAAQCLISASFHVGISQKKPLPSCGQTKLIPRLCTTEIVIQHIFHFLSFFFSFFICTIFIQSRTALWLYSLKSFVLPLSQMHLFFSPQSVVGLLIEEPFSGVACQAIVTKHF